MQPPTALGIDPRAVASVVATMLQSFRLAGAGRASDSGIAGTAYENRSHPGDSSPETGLHLPAPVHPQTGAPPPGEHRTPIRAPGQGPPTGLAAGADPGARSRPGDLRHADGQPSGLPAGGGRGLPAESRSRLRPGGLAPVSLRSGLAPL